MLRYVNFLISIFLWSCTLNAYSSNHAIYAPLVREITDAFAHEIEAEFDLFCEGGGGGMPDDVREIEVDFVAYRRATIEEARVLEVKATERLLKKINEHEKIRPYLREFPFPPDRAHVRISFQKEDDSFQSDGTVTIVSQARNKLFYSIANPFTERLVHLAEEPYEDALKIVKNTPLREDNYRTHQGKEYERPMDQLLDSFAKEMKRESGLFCTASGGLMANGIEEVSVKLLGSRRKASIEQARMLEVKATEKLLKAINSNEKIRPYLKEYPFTAAKTKVFISFEKSPMHHYTDGSVACVYPIENKLAYFTEPPPLREGYISSPLIPLLEESYEDALNATNKKSSIK